ncbi:helix-turn-helix domain-containing protein [Paenibacillus eucommiae]|uniref:YesN/AraC family two-component response regulator n=1 Tax=Paenibacillus eucommiae TaxID=1355755 RepID=A0ABS4J1Z4_9BACL|nr:AraC family transcriptional regulator [Paenibacillus eucommiae]MBP1993845.1 YesN/AraC family two-component response regulator [Paenibacillus eucommiae]
MNPGNYNLKRNSLFLKLMLGFTIIILISFLFNALSFNFYTKNIRNEIIRYNHSNMSGTVSNYEKQFRLLEDVTTNFFYNPNVAAIDRDPTDVPAMNLLAEEFSALVSGYNNLYLHNIILYHNGFSLIVDKNGLSYTEDLFAKDYVNSQYDVSFWREQASADYHMKIFPAAWFERKNMLNKLEPLGSFFPVIVKSTLHKQFYMIALIDAAAVFENTHHSVNDNFYMIDDAGTLFYSTEQRDEKDIIHSFDLSQRFFIEGSDYYFFEKGAATGITYVNVIPTENIASQVSRMNIALIVLLAFSVLISLFISILLSYKFKHPIQRIVESLQRMNPNFQLHSKINEFNLIGSNLKTMMLTNQNIRQDLQHKTTLLQKYGYLDKVKSINYSNKDVHSLIDTSKPFYFVMYRLHLTRQFHELVYEEQKKTSYFFEFINLNMQQRFPESVTLQSEKELIFSIVFADEGSSTEPLLETLHFMKQVFEKDVDYYFLSIAVHPELRSPAQFTTAYEEAEQIIRLRQLNNQTQIITGTDIPPISYCFSPTEESQFAAHLQAGKEADMLELIERMTDHLHKHHAPAHFFKQFANEAVSKILVGLSAQQIDISELQSEFFPYEQIKEIVTLEQYIDFFRQLIGRAAALANARITNQDPIVTFILNYFQQHYSEEIYLEMVADRLNITTSYMCKYIKQKTGKTFGSLLDEIRINKAKELLEADDCKIQEIAAQVGYQNANSFTRMFRRLTGVTPGEYRRDPHKT